jgi:hypothetical protein
MVGVGLISYSLYLVHWPAIVYWEYCAGELSIQSKLILAAASIALGYISYRWVEQPFRRTRPIWIVGPAFAFTLAAGVVMWLSDGWLWRIHPRPPYDIARGAAAFHLTYFGGVGRRTFNTWGCGGPIDVLLMGDSHAEALMHGLDKHLRDAHSINVHAAPTGSFIHLPGFTRTTEGVDWDRLAKRSLDQAIATIRAQPVPPVVVLAHSWVSQMKRGASIDEDGRRRPGELTVSDVIDGVRRLKSLSGARVVLVVGQVPGSEVNCAEVLERPRLSRSLSDEHLARSKIRKGRELFNRQMAQHAQDSGEFLFVDPFECFCEDETCANLTADGLPVYSDRNHLSVWGSDIIVRCFAPLVVEQVMGTRLVQEGHSPTRLRIPPEAITNAGTGLFSVRLSDLGLPHHDLERSFTVMKLIEDDDCLSPGGATDEEIRRGGGWRVATDEEIRRGGGWRVDASGVLIFASPDGTDPRKNGRVYEIQHWQPTQIPRE